MFRYSRDSHRGLFSLGLAGAMCFTFKWASHSQRSVQGLSVASLVGHHHAFRNIAAIVVLASSAAMLQTSKKAIEQVPFHKSVISESEKMLEVLNPQYAENKQNARVIQSLQEKQKAQDAQLAELKAQNSEMLAILRQLNGSGGKSQG